MTEMERAQRAAVVAEARRWLKTPFHDGARVLGAGVDCAQLIAAVYEAVGLIPHIMPEHYPSDWAMHRDEEKYLAFFRTHAFEATTPLPGDSVLWRFGRCFSHGAIVVDWPIVIHAHKPARCVTLCDAEAEAVLVWRREGIEPELRERLVFTLWRPEPA